MFIVDYHSTLLFHEGNYICYAAPMQRVHCMSTVVLKKFAAVSIAKHLLEPVEALCEVQTT